jgi:DNA-directed RNA polymerase specialized sigma24 family protein
MPEETITRNDTLTPAQPIPCRTQQFTERMHALKDGQPKDEATVDKDFDEMEEMFDLIAAGLYTLASMLVGEGEDSIRLVETAVANADIPASHDPAETRTSSRRALCAAALDTLTRRDAASLAAPQGLEHAATCIEDDDLDAADVSSEEFKRMITGPDRDRVRNWLESLPTAMRTIFVLRAVAGMTTAETADLLKSHGGPQAAGWTGEAVRELFRQGLCSLASHVLQAASSPA